VEGLYDFPFYLKGDETGCRNDRGIYFYQLQEKFFNILLSKLTPYANEITGEHQCGLWRNRPTPDHIFCIRQRLEKEFPVL
jgi:hypothetical protein